jgi:hypothetical protein
VPVIGYALKRAGMRDRRPIGFEQQIAPLELRADMPDAFASRTQFA